MKIGLLDADLMDHGTRHPNLALMKISGYYKDNGHEVQLIYRSYFDVYEYEKVFVSKVFTFSNIPDWILELPNVQIGGTGFFEDGGENLPYEIEHHKPDYDLYKQYVEEQLEKGRSRTNFADYLDYSIGFTTRGCFRKCAFCVNKKYDRVHRHSPIDEFIDRTKPYIYLWDDNFLAFPQWEEILDDLEKTEKPFQFRQGIDLRLMTDRKAYRFNNTHYHGDFIFAFDHLKDRDIIIDKVQLWKRYSSRVCKMYVLSGFESQDEKDIENVFERIAILMKYGSLPYIMRYEKYKTSPYRGMYIELARWCNQPQFFKKKSFREFCIANQEYKKNQETNCAAYRTMLDFESKFPHIAEKYFDLKFEEENIYKIQYGYGRKYENKPLCSYCKKQGICWKEFLFEDVEMEKKFLKLYLEKEIDLQCLTYENSECVDVENIVQRLIHVLLKYSIKDILEILENADNLETITKDNIPQISSVDDAIYGVNKILHEFKEEVSFDELANSLYDGGKQDTIVAKRKYGENHAKLSTLMDLTVIRKKGVKSNVSLSLLGKSFHNLSNSDKEELSKRLMLRIPIVQSVLLEKTVFQIDKDLEVLSVTTKRRRSFSVKTILRWMLKDDKDLAKLIGLNEE